MEILEEKIKAFLTCSDGSGNGFGKGQGYGSGDGSGQGYGNGSGNGYGSGDGNGQGYGFGDGNGFGNGSGNGYGFGNGSGNGYGFGNGSGNGYGFGDGNGFGNGSGNGYGVTEIDGMKIYQIDNTQTIITSVKGNMAKGYTIRGNTQLVPCYIAKVGNFFAHGKTSHEALQAAQEKYDEDAPLPDRISDTIRKYPTLDTLVPHQELFSLHHILTGSCKFGREEFCKSKGLDPTKGEMTMRDFILLTKDAFGSQAIHILAKEYNFEL